MKRRTSRPIALGCCLVLSAFAATNPALAGMCDGDEEPAATLLLPYFEVDLDNPSSGNTVFSVNNARAEPALALVTFWTDWARPTLSFHIFLTGFDVQMVNLAEVFRNGNIPLTADLQSDPNDQISPHGGTRSDSSPPPESMPDWDGSFPGCENFFPFYVNPVIAGENRDRLVYGHTGQPLPQLGDTCLGADFGDNVARGYVTIDRVNECSIIGPTVDLEGFFADDGTGVVSNVNQLWGDWLYIDRDNGFAQGDSLVHIEALDGFDAVGDGTSDPMVADPASGYTFYGRYTDHGEDNREPLGATWGARYLNGPGLSPGGTDFLVWRDTAVDLPASIDLPGHTCGLPGSTGSGPDWHPLDESLVVTFDESENAVQLCQSQPGLGDPPQPSNPHCFPLATQRMDSAQFGYDGQTELVWESGWTYLDLTFPSGEGRFGGLSQSHVSVSHRAQGMFSVGLPALELTSACETDPAAGAPDV